MNNPPKPALLDEYGLNEVTWRLLVKIAAHPEPMTWTLIKRISKTEHITGNPAQSLRKLIDRGLLTGPARHEDLITRPMAATQPAYDLIKRIERGLHPPEWITASRVVALDLLRRSGPLPIQELVKQHHIRQITLSSLAEHGYLELSNDYYYHITDLGREALAEYVQSRLTVFVINPEAAP